MKFKDKVMPYLRRSKTFQIGHMNFEYFISGYNSTRHNERCVEIPFIVDILKLDIGKNILEIGNVLSNYFDVKAEFGPNYRIVDKFEKGPGVINFDIMDVPDKKQFDTIISISTFEHIGNYSIDSDEKQAELAIEHVKGMLKKGGIFVCSIPIGFHKTLEASFYKHFDRIICMKRVNSKNEWIECKLEDLKDVKYGTPFNGGNGLLIGLYGVD